MERRPWEFLGGAMKNFLSISFIFILSSMVFGQTPKAPTGWRFPQATDFSGDWKTNRKKVPSPYKISGDFNGDGLKDEGWILIPTTGKAMGVFVFLRQRDNSYRTVQLDYFEGERPQESYISVAPKDKYQTACGKGYWDCSANEPAVLDLKTEGIFFGVYESGSKIFYWSALRKTFESVAISD